MTHYLIKYQAGMYELFKPRAPDRRPNAVDVGYWDKVFGDINFSGFCSALYTDYFPEAGEDLHVFFDSTTYLLPDEREHIRQMSLLSRVISHAVKELKAALENSHEVKRYEETEVFDLQEMIKYALKELGVKEIPAY